MRGRRFLLVLVVAGAAAGCGPVNAGSAFAEQMEPFVAGREAVVDHVVTSDNTLPFSGSAEIVVDLDPALTRRQVVEEAVAIMTHRVEDPVGYALTVRYPAPSGDGTDSVAAARLEVSGAADDDAALRDAVSAAVDRGAALVALGTGRTISQPEPLTSRLVTEADALEVWSALCDDPALLEQVGPLEVSTGTVDLEPGLLLVDRSRTTAQVEGAPGDGCARLPAVSELLALARDLGAVERYDADVDIEAPEGSTPRDPGLSVTFESPPADAATLRERATELGVDLELVLP